jgi:hypothetical protein
MDWSETTKLAVEQSFSPIPPLHSDAVEGGDFLVFLMKEFFNDPFSDCVGVKIDGQVAAPAVIVHGAQNHLLRYFVKGCLFLHHAWAVSILLFLRGRYGLSQHCFLYLGCPDPSVTAKKRAWYPSQGGQLIEGAVAYHCAHSFPHL